MEFSAPENHKIKGLSVSIVGRPSNEKDGSLTINDAVHGEKVVAEIGFTDIPAADVEAVRGGNQGVMGKYAIGERIGPFTSYFFINCAAVIEMPNSSLSVSRALEKL